MGVGEGIKLAKVDRSQAWITSKVGPGGYHFPLGYNDTLSQAAGILKNYSTTHVDLLLIHAPEVQLPFVVSPQGNCRGSFFPMRFQTLHSIV